VKNEKMRPITSYIISVVICWSCAQKPEYNTTRTDDHIRIQGSNAYIIPPEGLLLNPNAPGFNNQYAQLTLETMPMTFEEMSTTFIDSLLGTAVLDLRATEDLTYNGYNAKSYQLVDSRQAIDYEIKLLLIGGPTNCVFATGLYPLDSTKIADIINSSLESIVYRPELDFENYSAYFDFDVDSSGYQVADITNQGLLLTPTGSPDLYIASSFISATVTLNTLNANQYELYVRANTQSIETEDPEGYAVELISMHGKSGFQVKSQLENRLMYIVFLFDDQLIYKLSGAARNEFDKAQQSFDDLFSTAKIGK
jgi:hypothetical protein